MKYREKAIALRKEPLSLILAILRESIILRCRTLDSAAESG